MDGSSPHMAAPQPNGNSRFPIPDSQSQTPDSEVLVIGNGEPWDLQSQPGGATMRAPRGDDTEAESTAPRSRRGSLRSVRSSIRLRVAAAAATLAMTLVLILSWAWAARGLDRELLDPQTAP